MSKCLPFGGGFSTNTNTGTATVVCSVASLPFSSARIISPGFHHRTRCWECIKTVKMATVTVLLAFSPFGDDEYIWYTVAPVRRSSCHSSTPALTLAAPGYKYLSPPFQSPPDFHLWLLSLSLDSSIHPVSSDPLFLFSPPSIQLSSAACYSPSLSNTIFVSAASGFLGCSHNSDIINPLLTQPFHSLSTRPYISLLLSSLAY